MCKCDPRILNPYCGNGDCQYPVDKVKIDTQLIKNQAFLISNRESARFYDMDFKWDPTDKQWETVLKKCKEIGLSVIDTKELRKLENFYNKIDSAVRDYPNY